MKSLIRLAICLSLALILSSQVYAKNSADPKTLRVALLPDESAATIIKKNEGLKAYLENILNKKIDLVVTTDYSSMIEAMRHGRLEMAYFGPLSYLMAKSKSDIEAFAAREYKGEKTYQAVVIASRVSGIKKYQEIKGKNMAYGDTASTSSHLIPKSMLKVAGLEPKTDYSEHFLGAHDAVAMSVQNGKADAGGLSRPIFESLVAKGTISMDKVRILGYSNPFPEYPWTMRSDLDPALKEKIKNAFYQLKDEKILKAFKATGFAVMTDADYDVVRDLAQILDLDLAKM
ncbi:MAG: phosphate/phosphite/phosphonate ABC transporter substrate-binding protein [Pseudomonadota bacterium]